MQAHDDDDETRCMRWTLQAKAGNWNYMAIALIYIAMLCVLSFFNNRKKII